MSDFVAPTSIIVTLKIQIISDFDQFQADKYFQTLHELPETITSMG